ncbi:MAG: sigma-54 interaction domain-containing protein [Pirellulales bacterium]
MTATVWREACRHIEIAESAAAIAAALATALPLRGLVVLRPDPASRTLETIASGSADARFEPAARGRELSTSAWQRLVRWLRSDDIADTSDATAWSWLATALPEGCGRQTLAGPLRTEAGPHGLLVVVAHPGREFSGDDLDLVRRLLEPLTVALENDGRLHELRALREAAEADRQTLLSRLGRQEINEDVVGARTGLKHVMERVELVASSDLPVLILGETGTGKEVVSRAIHARSKRADGPFIRVNCGAIPPELIDSQLFGHEKGSFTGASQQHLGWFERADRGTLFLDEIGELPLPAQVRLLRVLQDHQIERVGGRSPVHVDVRIVAATHRDLSTMVKDRSFREDLWYRINVFPILLPTLRERIEDVPALVRHFAQRAATRFGLPAVEPSAADLALLSSYGWPGNIRELGAVIDRAVILGGGRTLAVEVALGLGRPPAVAPAPVDDATLYEVIPLAAPEAPPARDSPTPHGLPTLAEAMRQHIELALAATRGRIEGRKGAAALLDINPHTLRARMRKLRVDAGRYRD